MSLGEERLKALRKLLQKNELSTQDDLKKELRDLKFKVTQSTISRDLRRLGAVKVVDTDGRTVYRLIDNDSFSWKNRLGLLGASGGTAAPKKALYGMIYEITHNGSLIVIQTEPGSASFVARELDRLRHHEIHGILGTIAGDDTIFVAPAKQKNISKTLEAIKKIFEET